MKVKFKYGIATYSGKLDEMVYGSYRDGKLCIGREFVYPRLTENNAILGGVGVNLAILWATGSEAFKADMKTYAQRNGTENVPKTKLPPNSYALWIRMIYAWAEDNPSVDLSTLNSEDFDIAGSDVSSVKNAVDNDYLPKVNDYSQLSESF